MIDDARYFVITRTPFVVTAVSLSVLPPSITAQLRQLCCGCMWRLGLVEALQYNIMFHHHHLTTLALLT